MLPLRERCCLCTWVVGACHPAVHMMDCRRKRVAGCGNPFSYALFTLASRRRLARRRLAFRSRSMAGGTWGARKRTHRVMTLSYRFPHTYRPPPLLRAVVPHALHGNLPWTVRTFPLCAPSTPRPTPMRAKKCARSPTPTTSSRCCTRSVWAWPPTASPGPSATSCQSAAWPWPTATARWRGCASSTILLSAERARQNGGPEHYVGDRVMEGLMLAALALTNHAIFRLHPE